MKNKFKKSKIIVPALALITATTAASVTGTVAWFTASRTATVTADAFATTKVDSQLNVTITGDTNSGTAASTTAGAVTVAGKITHGSYNAVAGATGSLYVANLNDEKAVTGYKDLGTSANHVKTTTVDGVSTSTNKWLAKTADNDADKVWFGVSWKMNFSYTATVDNETNYLLFDVNGSKFEDSANPAGQTLPGLRIAFMTADKFLVVGGDDTKTYTKGTGITANDTGTYTDNYVTISDSTAKLVDGASDIASSKFNLGVLPSNGTTALTVTCVAWFEGSDSTIVNQMTSGSSTTPSDTLMSKVKATLEFYSRKA